MSRTRKTYSPEVKLQVVMDVIRWRKTQAEITSEYWVHPNQQIRWKEEFLKEAPNIFKDKRKKENESDKKKIAQLERKVGQYAMEVDWLQKKIDWLDYL